MEIRKIRSNEVDEFWELRLEALKAHPEAFENDYEDSLAKSVEEIRTSYKESNDSFIVGAFTDGRLVGTTCFQRHINNKVRHKGFIWGLYVSPEVRGIGLSKALLLKTIEYVKNLRGVEQINIVVEATNIPAMRACEAVEFEEYGFEKNAMKINGKYVDEVHLVRFL